MRSILLNPAFLIVTIILGSAALGMSWAINAYGLYLQKKPIEARDGRTVASIPDETKDWIRIGPDRLETPEVLEELGTTNYLTRVYQQKNPAEGEQPERLELHLAYYTGMIDTVPHVPERCFVGGGLSIGEGSEVHRVTLDGSGWIEDTSDRVPEDHAWPVYMARLDNQYSDAPGTRVRLPGDPHELDMLVTGFVGPGGHTFYSGYFFVANGGTVARAEGVRLLAFKLQDDYAFYLKVQFTSFSAQSPEQLAELAGSLLDDLYAEISRCIPDWVEVEAGRYPPEAASDA
ncbi:MAG: exosortase-associated EpsI family protein [Planctomycetota bacterium]